jgi:hypothetical protein
MLDNGIRMGFVAEIKQRSDCVFCSLVYEMLKNLASAINISLEEIGQRTTCSIDNLVQSPIKLYSDLSNDHIHQNPFALQLLILTTPPLVSDPFGASVLDRLPSLLIQRLSDEHDSVDSCYGKALPDSSVDFQMVSGGSARA